MAQLRWQGETAKAVAVTASVLGYKEDYFIEAGFDAFVGKSYRSEEIVACLEQLLGVTLEGEAPAAAAQAAAEGPLALPAALALPLRRPSRRRAPLASAPY